VSAVVVQVIFAPFVQLAAPAQVVHGALPVVEKVVPATHGTLHAKSVVVVQENFTPWVHVAIEAAAQGVQGALPDVEKVAPATHAHLSAAQSVT
jgi:hypothetical protein